MNIFFLFLLVGLAKPETYLKADGNSSRTYYLIDSIFGGTGSAVENPDCNHTSFGPHITQVYDSTLDKQVFAFHSHIKVDDDRCQKFDRQRIEIKTNEGFQLTGHLEERMSLSWDFKLDSNFLPPYSFCHIHQLKAVGGDDSMPIITLTPRKSSPNELQLLHYDSKGSLLFLKVTELQPFLGKWIHSRANVTFGHEGKYSLELSGLEEGGKVMFKYESNSTDLWRNETDYIRPKWGIYRSVQEAVLSRDETILFNNFCVGVGNNEICD